jgi:hypothetical protein
MAANAPDQIATRERVVRLGVSKKSAMLHRVLKIDFQHCYGATAKLLLDQVAFGPSAAHLHWIVAHGIPVARKVPSSLTDGNIGTYLSMLHLLAS